MLDVGINLPLGHGQQVESMGGKLSASDNTAYKAGPTMLAVKARLTGAYIGELHAFPVMSFLEPMHGQQGSVT